MSRNAVEWSQREIEFFNHALTTLDFACSDPQTQDENFNPIAIIDNLFFQIKNFYGYTNPQNISAKIEVDNFVKYLLCGYAGYQHPLLTACANFNPDAVSGLMKNIWQLQNHEINALVTENLLTSYLVDFDQDGYPIFENHNHSAISNALDNENTRSLFELIHGVRMLFNDDSRCHNFMQIILNDFDQENFSIRTHKILAQFGLSQYMQYIPPQQFTQPQVVTPQNIQQQMTVQPPAAAVAPVQQTAIQQEPVTPALPQNIQSHLNEENDVGYRIADGDEEEEMMRRLATRESATIVASQSTQEDQEESEHSDDEESYEQEELSREELSADQERALANIQERLRREYVPQQKHTAQEEARHKAWQEERARQQEAIRKQREAQAEKRRQQLARQAEEDRIWLEEQRARIAKEQEELKASIAARRAEITAAEQSVALQLAETAKKMLPEKHLAPEAPAPNLGTRPTPKSTGEKLPNLSDPSALASSSANATKKPEQKPTKTIKVKTASFQDFLKFFGTKYSYAYIISDFLDEDQEKQNLILVQKEFVDFVQFLHGAEIKDFNLRAHQIFTPSYVDFDAITDFWLYYNYVGKASKEAAERTVTKLSQEHDRIVKKALYFMSNQQEIPLWLQQDIAQNGGVAAIAEMIPNQMIAKFFATQKAAQLPTDYKLQDLLIKGATFEAIEEYIRKNAKTNPQNLEIVFLNKLVTHPQSAKILELLDRTKVSAKPILTPELLNKAFTEAAEIGAFDFFNCKKEWAQAWIDSDAIKAALAKSSLSYKYVEQEEEDFLVNILRAAETADLNITSFARTSDDLDNSVSSRVLMKFLYSSIILRDLKSEKDLRKLFNKFSQFSNTVTSVKQDVVKGKRVVTIDTAVATKAVVNATKLVSLQNPEAFVPVARAALQTLSLQRDFNDMLLEDYYNDYITGETGVSLISDVLKRLVREQKIEAFEETLHLIQESGRDTLRTILKEKQFDDESISEVVAKDAPQAFAHYYSEFIKPLDSAQKQSLFRIEPQEDSEIYLNSFLNDAVKACLACDPADFKSLKEILKDIQDTVRIDEFYELLTTKLKNEEKTPLAMIRIALENESDPEIRKYFQKLFKETREKAEHLKNYDRFIEDSSQRFMPSLSDIARSPAVASNLVSELLHMSNPHNAKYIQNYFYEKTNLVSRVISHLNNSSIFPFSITELGYLSPTVLKNIIYNFLAYDSEKKAPTHNFPRHNFAKAKLLKQISKEEELAVEIVAHGLMARPFPLWMLDQIEAVGKKSQSTKAESELSREELVNKGFARIIEAVKNSAIKRFIIFEKAQKSKKTSGRSTTIIEGAYPIQIGKEGKAKTLQELVNYGATLPEFLRFFTSDKKKDYHDIKGINVAILIAHPNVNEIRDLIFAHYHNLKKPEALGTINLLEVHLFDAAIVSGNRDYFIKNKARFELILNTIIAQNDSGPIAKIVPTIVGSSFEGQRAMLPVYECISQLNGHPLMRQPFPFATPAGLLEHMKKGAEIDPQGFYDYLLEVKSKITAKNFKMLLINDLRAGNVGIIDLVHQTDPQKLDDLEKLYATVFEEKQMDPYRTKIAKLRERLQAQELPAAVQEVPGQAPQTTDIFARLLQKNTTLAITHE